MTPVNAAGGTVNSSSATVTLPAGATVLWAGLYWGADRAPGRTGGGTERRRQGTVKLKVPGGTYQAITATAGRLPHLEPQSMRYRAFRDVTAQVAAGGAGTYWVGDVQTGTGHDRFAGWALFVAYRDNAQPVRRLNVYDGLGTVDRRTPSRPSSRPSTRPPPAP